MFHSFCESRIQEQTHWVICLQRVHEVAVKLSFGVAVIRRVAWGWKPASKVAHSDVWQVPAGCGEGLASSPWGCLSYLTTWQLASPGGNDPRAKVEATVSYDLALDAMHRFFCGVLLDQL